MIKKKHLAIGAGALCLVAMAAQLARRKPPTTLALTGIVTTDDVVVGPQVAGRLVKLLVREGDHVTRGQALAEIEPAELEADRAFYVQTANVLGSQVDESVASLRYQERENAARIRQAAASLAAAESDRAVAAAQLEDARSTFAAEDQLAKSGATPAVQRDHARLAVEAAKARVASLDRQIDAQRAALDLARASAEQALGRRAALATTRHQQVAAEAQRTKADVRLAYTHLVAPIDGVVDVRAAHLGEFVGVGQTILTLIDPDDLWVRTDVEESYVDTVRIGDRLRVRFPSGDERDGTVFHRGVDAAFATQRDVSRTKRDIRTFEVRLRVDNADRRLALGSSATVSLPVDGARP